MERYGDSSLVSGWDCGVDFGDCKFEVVDFGIVDLNGDDGFLGGDLLFGIVIDLAGVDISSGQPASLLKFSLFGDK